ncbi:MAG TPA: hypothetical protein ENO30_01085 [Thermodesulfobium narugense]|nr:hypothetical protein [Thermodesulfobium narugense]
MKYKVHKVDVRGMVETASTMEDYINSLDGEIVSVAPMIVTHIGPSLHPEACTDYFIVIEKVAN